MNITLHFQTHTMPLITEQQFGDLTNVQEAMLEILDFERRRIALDLHDRVQNSLRFIRDKNTQNRPLFDDLEHVLHEVRTIAYQLTPKSLQEFSLVDYLNIYETNLNLIYGDQFNTDYRTDVDFYLPKSIENQLFSIVQECVNNVLKHAQDTPLLCIRLRKEANAVVLLVQDFGKGFDTKKVDIAQTVGLHSIATRANFIGAKCEIEAAENVGCKVRITVPMSVINAHKEEMQTYQNATKTKIPRHEDLKSYPTQNILVVDNQREIALGLQDLLERNHRKVYVAHSAKEAKVIFEKHKEEIQVVITDITMPDESGMSLVEHIRSENETIRCIFYSINDNPAYIFRAKHKLQIDAYVWKEEVQTDDDSEHTILKALAHFEDEFTGTPFYSAQIEKIAETLNEKKYVSIDDSKYRDIFALYLKLRHSTLNNSEYDDKRKNIKQELEQKRAILYNKDNGKKKGVTAKEVEAKIKEELQRKVIDLLKPADIEKNLTIDDKFRELKSNVLGIDDDTEILNLLNKITNDFGLYKSIEHL